MRSLSVHLVTLLLAFLLSACTSSAYYTDRDYCAATVNPTMARVVLNRGWNFAGGGAKFVVTDNSQPIGWVKSNGKLCWDRYPGYTRLTIVSQWGLQFEAEAGQVYEVTFDIDDGLTLVSAKR